MDNKQLEALKARARQAIESHRGDGFAELVLTLATEIERWLPDPNWTPVAESETATLAPDPVDIKVDDENHVDEKPKRGRRRGNVS